MHEEGRHAEGGREGGKREEGRHMRRGCIGRRQDG